MKYIVRVLFAIGLIFILILLSACIGVQDEQAENTLVPYESISAEQNAEEIADEPQPESERYATTTDEEPPLNPETEPEDPRSSVTGTILFIDGMLNEDGTIPDYVDLLRLFIAAEDGNTSIVFIASQWLTANRTGTLTVGTLEIGAPVTVYYFNQNKALMGAVPVYIASIVVTDDTVDFSGSVHFGRFNAPHGRYAVPGFLNSDGSIMGLARFYSLSQFKPLSLPVNFIGYSIAPTITHPPAIKLEDGTIMLPFIESAIYFNVISAWFNESGAITLMLGAGRVGTSHTIWVGSTSVYNTDGSPSQLCTPPKLIDGIIYVPLSYFSNESPFHEGTAVYDDRIEIIRHWE